MKSSCLLVLLASFCLLIGCATVGSKLDGSTVKQFQKGVTTKAEVEAKIGVPTGPPSLLPDGRRQVTYMYIERHGDILTYVPFVNYVAGGTIGRNQNLQIIYKDGILQDYELSDTTEHSEGGMLNQHGTPVPTTPGN